MSLPAGPFVKHTLSAAAAAMLLVVFAAPVSAREPQASAAQVVVSPDRERTRMNARVFDTVWDTVRRRYYDPNLHGVDWRAARETYRPQALAAADDRALYRALGEMLDLLDDDHAGAISPAQARRQDQARTRRAVMGVMLARLDADAWRIDAVRPGSPAEEAGIEVGWVLQTVDGQSWGVDFDVEAGRPTLLTFLDEAGQTRTVTLVPREMDPLPPFTVDTSRAGAVVLRVDGFEAGLGRWLGEQLAAVPVETDVVIDLRGNPGGLLLEADAALSCFLPARQPWATRVARNGRPVTLTIMPGCGDLREPAPHDVAVLVDSASRSAAELTPAALQEAGRALVVGEHTAGSVLISQDTVLPDGGRLTLSRADYITSGGVRLEKRGVAPDVVVARTVEDRRAGRDPVLDAALEALNRQELARAAAAGAPTLAIAQGL
ncbi:peptidase S41 [Brevundimonas sp. AAP58]|uniref:S41 family peptidase n=1 Tax=Brevundimonas sp. AAP58 TaxID=1523422 RepID=UPI0006B96291|nr:S41 family peptidase [Brevundimonas sp. AAP58]KPF80746.1 peptidase S41 [Brevundimonas sp. AAP58]